MTHCEVVVRVSCVIRKDADDRKIAVFETRIPTSIFRDGSTLVTIRIMRVLPPPLSNAIASMHWPLDTMPPPLYFQSLEQMQRIRQQDEDRKNHPLWEFFTEENTVKDTLDTLFGSTTTTTTTPSSTTTDDYETMYFGWISMALILLGHGGTDECHNLVTPLSWPDDISFAHGPSLYAHVSPAVRTYATYVHALV